MTKALKTHRAAAEVGHEDESLNRRMVEKDLVERLAGTPGSDNRLSRAKDEAMTTTIRRQSRVVASAVIDPAATTADDTYGHGTAVAGLIAGDGDRRDPRDPDAGQYAGSAPNANLISIKIADDAGNSTILDAIYGLQFAVDHQQQYNIRVINLSLRSTTAESATIAEPPDGGEGPRRTSGRHALVRQSTVTSKGRSHDDDDPPTVARGRLGGHRSRRDDCR